MSGEYWKEGLIVGIWEAVRARGLMGREGLDRTSQLLLVNGGI